ncbi:MAG: ligase-associated DNA damage response endonuclease PdeM [Luteolibacter sp.]
MAPLPIYPDLTLLPEGAALLTSDSTLIVADVHLGKSAAFRARGLPIPEGDTARDFQRLIELAVKCKAARLVIAGDLFHAPSGITPELEAALEKFLAEIGIPVTLVMGNHDIKLRAVPEGLHPVPYLDMGETLRIIHDPAYASGGRFHVSGHWHPMVKIPDGKRTYLRLPCFLLRENTLVLPAFGSFTGGAIMKTQAGDRVFVSLRDEIVELPPGLI